MGSVFKINQLAGIWDDFGVLMGDIFETLLQGIITFVANWFYTIYLIFATVLDLIQALFRKLAGLESYVINGQTQYGGDIALQIINSPVIKDIFWSMVILGVILLFITTFVAVIKSEYQPLETKGANSKGRVIGKALKSFVLMATVPIVAIFGLLIGNALLYSLDMATSSSAGSNLSGRIFVAAAYEANRAREGVAAYDAEFVERLEEKNNFDIFTESGSTGFIVETIADKIDDAFQNEIEAPSGKTVDFTMTDDENAILAWFYDKVGAPGYPDTFDINNYKLVWFYYDLRSFNFFVGIGVSIMLITILLQVLLGLIKRIYALTILFVVAPPIMGMSQLDEGIFKNWKKAFVASAISAYSVVVTMNIFIMLIPILGQIEFFAVSGITDVSVRTTHQVFNYLAQLLIIIGGAVFFKDFSKELAGIIGGADALGDGAAKGGEFIKAATKASAITGSLAKPFTKPVGGSLKTAYKAAQDYRKGRQQGLTSWAAASQAASNAKKSVKASLKSTPKNVLNAAKNFNKSSLYKNLGIDNIAGIFTPNAKANKEKKQKNLEQSRHEELIQAITGKEKDGSNKAAGNNEKASPQKSEIDTAMESYLGFEKDKAESALGGKDKDGNIIPGINTKINSLKKEIKSSKDKYVTDAKKRELKELKDSKANIIKDIKDKEKMISGLKNIMKVSGTDNLDDIIDEAKVDLKKFVYDKDKINDTVKELKDYMKKTKEQADNDKN
jgi:hypothetical protein